MKTESEAINRLTKIQSEVSCHYLIKKSGEIITMVPESYIAWHAGKSSWGNHKSLNKNSIGIEVTNSGHEFSYKKFTKKQINSLLKLSRFLEKGGSSGGSGRRVGRADNVSHFNVCDLYERGDRSG